MKRNTGRINTRFLVELGVLIALELLLEITGLGFIKTAFAEFTIMQIPVVIGAIVLGPLGGTILGAVFGLTSFWECFGKSLFGSTLLAIDPFATFLMCVVPRVLMGLLSGLLFRGLRKIRIPDDVKGQGKLDRALNAVLGFFRKTSVRCGITGLVGALLNTFLFMGLLVAFFGRSDYLLAMGSDNVLLFIVTMVGVQGIIEAVVCCVVSASVSYALLKARRK